MKNLTEYILETKAPVFNITDKNSVKDFCSYVFDENVEFTVNNDLSVNLTKSGNDPVIYINAKDLKELPNITFICPDKILGVYGDKLNSIVKISGSAKGFNAVEVKKITGLDLSDLTLNSKDSILMIEKNTKLETIIGPTSEVTNIKIRLNKSLTDVDLSNIKRWGLYNYILNNRQCKLDVNKLPKLNFKKGQFVSNISIDKNDDASTATWKYYINKFKK